MANRLKFLKCGCEKLYSVQQEKKRCSSHGYEWKPRKLPLHLTRQEWARILHWLLRYLPIFSIAQKTGIERKRVLRALTYVRMAFQKDIPNVFSGTVEVDETYLGGQWKNKRHSAKSGGTKRGRGTLKTPVFGILCRGGKVWAQVVPDVEAKTLLPLISRRVEAGSIVCSDTWKSYTGVAAKGYVHRLVKHHA